LGACSILHTSIPANRWLTTPIAQSAFNNFACRRRPRTGIEPAIAITACHATLRRRVAPIPDRLNREGGRYPRRARVVMLFVDFSSRRTRSGSSCPVPPTASPIRSHSRRLVAAPSAPPQKSGSSTSRRRRPRRSFARAIVGTSRSRKAPTRCAHHCARSKRGWGLSYR
jgi:hypothetical protein